VLGWAAVSLDYLNAKGVVPLLEGGMVPVEHAFKFSQ
jgi:hypothetical protein